MRKFFEKWASMKCLITQLVFGLILLTVIHSYFPRGCPKAKAIAESPAREIQKEIRGYRVQLESEAQLLKKVNQHQRNEENLNAAISQKDALIEGLQTKLKSIEAQLNATRERMLMDEDEEKAEKEPGDDNEKAEKEITADESKNKTFLLPNQLTREAAPVGIAIALIADNNEVELQKTITSISQHMPATGFPLFISQYGEDEAMSALIQSQLMEEGQRTNIFHLQYVVDKEHKSASKRETDHSFWTLSQLFDNYGYSKAVILDDNLNVAFDFFDYLQASSALLDTDSSIMCVSAWNENGQADFAKDSSSLIRTDIFPEYSSMISNSFWREIKRDWPASDWKSFVRTLDEEKRRACIIPEVCRVSVRKQPSMSEADEEEFEKYFSNIKLNKNPVKFGSMDLNYLSKPKYDLYIRKLVETSTTIPTASALKDYRGQPGNIKILYEGTKSYVSIARILNLPSRLRDGYPPASYYGLVIIRYGTWRVFITPKNWEKLLGYEDEETEEMETLAISGGV
mmetsp:Transcript_7499/g.18231  ORF Transcript_7499/g.18231 Transcript_7499/m.18231 type:complete len:514 (-) Transcript_7499:266-1807(-)